MKDYKLSGWRKNYDICNLDSDGYLVLFGEHYSVRECKDKIIYENYDDPEEYSNFIQHIWVHFGFINFEGERTNGWIEIVDKPKSMKGKIKATIIYTKEQYQNMLKISQ